MHKTPRLEVYRHSAVEADSSVNVENAVWLCSALEWNSVNVHSHPCDDVMYSGTIVSSCA